MRKWVLVRIGVVLFGAGVSLVVAVGCALADPGGDVMAQRIPEYSPAESLWQPSERKRVLAVWVAASFGAATYTSYESSNQVTGGINYERKRRVSGWPMRCLVADLGDKERPWIPDVAPKQWSWRETWRRGAFVYSSSWGTQDPIWIPVRLWWPGFAVNTVFYGVALMALVCGVRGGRRWWRSVNHRCLACGYPIGSSSVCSECGGGVQADIAAQPDIAGSSDRVE